MEALDTGSSASDTAMWSWCSRWLRPGFCVVDERFSQCAVSAVCILDVVTWNLGLSSSHSTVGLKRAHPTIQVGIAQPEQSGHWGSVVEIGGVADHHWCTLWVAYDNDEFTTRLAPEEKGDRRKIRLEGLLLVQDRVSDDGGAATTER